MTIRVFCSFTSYSKPAVHRKNTPPTLQYTRARTHKVSESLAIPQSRNIAGKPILHQTFVFVTETKESGTHLE